MKNVNSGEQTAAQECSGVKDGSRMSTWIPGVLLLMMAAATIYYITVAAKSEFHSDCTDTIYWAAAAYEGGTVLNPDFSYACLLPFGGSLLMLPFMPIFGLSMTTHVLGMLLFFILFTGCLYVMFRQLGWGYGSTWTGMAVVLGILLTSKKTREMFWGHTIYYSLGILFLLVGLSLLLGGLRCYDTLQQGQPDEKSQKSQQRRLLIFGVALGLWMVLTATDGVSALSIFSLPFLAAILAVQVLDTDTPLLSGKTTRVAGMLAVLALLMLVGILLGKLLAGGITAGYENAFSKYSAQDTWTEHVQELPLAWLTLFGVEDLKGTPIMSLESVINIFHIFGALLVAVLPIVASCFYRRFPKDRGGYGMQLWIWVHWAVTAIILIGYVFGLLSAANWRLLPILCTGLLVSIQFVRWSICTCIPSMRLPGLLFTPVLMLAVLSMCTVVSMPAKGYQDQKLYQLVDALEEAGVDYGYATFWYSNAATVISDSKVRVRTVEVTDTGVHRRNYQTLKSWYEDQPGQETYFLLLDTGEYSSLESIDDDLLTQAKEIRTLKLDCGSAFYLLIFDENIF
jgi:hypothetical protein